MLDLVGVDVHSKLDLLLDGRMTQTTAGADGLVTKKLDMSQVSQGTYFFKLTNGKEATIKKLIIRK